jgi:hypothetical protein
MQYIGARLAGMCTIFIHLLTYTYNDACIDKYNYVYTTFTYISNRYILILYVHSMYRGKISREVVADLKGDKEQVCVYVYFISFEACTSVYSFTSSLSNTCTCVFILTSYLSKKCHYYHFTSVMIFIDIATCFYYSGKDAVIRRK